MLVGPKLTPHWPQMADASASSPRRSIVAAASVPPMAGPPPGTTLTTYGRMVARRRAIGPAGLERGPRTRMACSFLPSRTTAIAPPTSARSERSRTSGCFWSTSSMTNRSGALAPHVVFVSFPLSQGTDHRPTRRTSMTSPLAETDSTWTSFNGLLATMSSGSSMTTRSASGSS